MANYALILASISITQCSVGIVYQIPIDKELKQEIFTCIQDHKM